MESYYVTVRDPDFARYGFLLGPFATHEEALKHVEAARIQAEKVNDRAIWYAYGTAKADRDAPGVLNAFFPELFPKVG